MPLPVVAGALVLCAVLPGLEQAWIGHIVATGAPEPPQWLAWLTVMQSNILGPFALIALWARRHGVPVHAHRIPHARRIRGNRPGRHRLDSRRGAPRRIELLVIAGFVLNYLVPWGMAIASVPLAVVILRIRPVRSRAATEPPSSVS